MKVDCKYMESQIKTLKLQIKDEMLRKFGKEISLTELYETVLRRMASEVQAQLNDKSVDFERKLQSKILFKSLFFFF